MHFATAAAPKQHSRLPKEKDYYNILGIQTTSTPE